MCIDLFWEYLYKTNPLKPTQCPSHREDIFKNISDQMPFSHLTILPILEFLPFINYHTHTKGLIFLSSS